MAVEESAQVYLVSGLLTQNLTGSWGDAETLLRIASQIVTAMNLRLEQSCVQLVRDFEQAALQRSAALPGSLRPRSTRPHRRGNGGSRDMGKRGGSAGAASLPGEQLVPRQRQLHPGPNAVGDNASSRTAYPLHAAAHQQQEGLNTASSFPSSTGSGYPQEWAPPTNETEFPTPAANQYGPQLEPVAISPWQIDAYASHPFSGSIQDNQPSVSGILESYHQTPASYGPHPNRGAHHPIFSAQYTP